MLNDSQRPDVAVFIDFENVYVSVRDKLDANPNFESIMDRCEDFGRVVIARAYADWYRYPRVTSALYANAIEPMYVPTYYYDRDMGRTGRPIKNSVDMNLCIDAMKTLYTNPNIGRFVLATGDRDFIPLVNTIRQQGKEVIVIGIGGAASSHLAQSADEFIFYESLVGKSVGGTVDDVPRAKMPEKGREYEGEDTPPPTARRNDRGDRSERAERPERNERPERSERELPRIEPATNGAATPVPAATPTPTPAPVVNTGPDVYDTLIKAINLARERGYVCSFGSLKLLMKELMGGEFKESRYKDNQGRPFAKFKDFVMEAERRGKVQVFTNGTVNEVFLPGEDPYKLSQFAAELKVDVDQSPITPAEADSEARSESRLGAPTGRRRRRRRPGRQSSDQNGVVTGADETDALDEFDGEDEETEGDLALPDLLDEETEGDLVLPDLLDEAAAEEVFEELLERIEVEDAQTALLSDADAEAIIEPETSEIRERVADAEDAAPGEIVDEVVAPMRAFDDEDRGLLRDVAAELGRPVSFAQIHDALRSARNRLTVSRTNEELRSLVKLGINSGMLARQGKGNRISYRLADPQPEDDQAAQTSDTQTQSLDSTDGKNAQAQLIDSADGNAPIETPDVSVALFAGLEQAAELASNPEQARQEVAEIEAEMTSLALEPESDISGVASIAPEPTEQPKPNTRRRKATPKQQAASDAPPAEEAAPKRATRRRTPAAEAPAAEAAPEAAPARQTHRRKAKTDDGQNE